MSNTIPAANEDQSVTKSLQSGNRFPWKLYQIVKACKSGAITWDESGRILLLRPEQFKREFLDPASTTFKTKNLGSFVRQLNLYGFHKLPASRETREDQQPKKPVIYRFQNDFFIRGRLDLLHKLHRNIGIRQRKQSFKCYQKENAQESEMSKDRIGSQFPMILPFIGRAWSSELKPFAQLTSCFETDLKPLDLSNRRRPLEELVKVEPQETLHESFIRSNLKIASLGSEDGNESQDVTMVKKDDFDQIVAVFVEMLRQDPAVRETSLARMDHGISTAVHDLIRRRAQIIRDYEARLKRSGLFNAENMMFLPVHDSSFSFSASASRPIFKVADNHMKNAVRMSIFEQNIHNKCTCMDFDNYKENLAYLSTETPRAH